MKTKLFIITAALLIASPSFADVTSMKASFGAGGYKKNTGKVIVKVSASGTDLGSDSVQIQYASAQRGPWRNISNRTRLLSASGYASFSFANQKSYGCFRVITARNGNDLPDIVSNKVCEK